MTPRELAGELGISPSTLRAWLRKEFPREPGERGPWRLDDGHVAAARTRWGGLAAERREREAEVASAATAALESRERAAPPAETAAPPTALAPESATGDPARGARPRVEPTPRPGAGLEPTPPPPGTSMEPTPRRGTRVEPAPSAGASVVPAPSIHLQPRRPHRPAPEPPPRVRPLDTPERRRAVSRGWQIEASVFSMALLLGGLVPLGVLTDASSEWLGAGASMIAFGLALDAYARALGGYAAHQAGERGWMWGCVLGGSPVVLVHAVVRRAGEPAVFEAAPLVALGALVLVFTLLGAAASGQGMGT